MISTTRKLVQYWPAVAVCAWMSVGLIAANRALAQDSGPIVMWGAERVVSPEELSDLTAIGAGEYHSLGLKADGSIVSWGATLCDDMGECDLPAPNADFVAIGSGQEVRHSLALRVDGSIVGWGQNNAGQCDPPSPNSDFIAGCCTGWNVV
jgi:alpha-tubulin suppressor-like RCC1 family protein